MCQPVVCRMRCGDHTWHFVQTTHADAKAAPIHPKLDDDSWHVFTGSRYDARTHDARTREWHMSKLPVHHII
jgi:hypothetical protein